MRISARFLATILMAMVFVLGSVMPTAPSVAYAGEREQPKYDPIWFYIDTKNPMHGDIVRTHVDFELDSDVLEIRLYQTNALGVYDDVGRHWPDVAPRARAGTENFDLLLMKTYWAPSPLAFEYPFRHYLLMSPGTLVVGVRTVQGWRFSRAFFLDLGGY